MHGKSTIINPTQPMSSISKGKVTVTWKVVYADGSSRKGHRPSQ